MLGVKSYTRAYIPRNNRRRVRPSSTSKPGSSTNMVMLLDAYFVHRLRMVEGKDGNPLNGGGVFTPEKAIQYVPERSVLQYHPGDAIGVTADGFLRLEKAFFEEIEKKFLAAT